MVGDGRRRRVHYQPLHLLKPSQTKTNQTKPSQSNRSITNLFTYSTQVSPAQHNSTDTTDNRLGPIHQLNRLNRLCASAESDQSVLPAEQQTHTPSQTKL